MQLQEKESLLVSSDARIVQLTNELRAVKDNSQTKIIEMNTELNDKQTMIRLLENSASSLRSKVGELEASFIQRDEEIAAKLLRRASIEDEHRQLRMNYESLSVQLSSNQSVTTEMRKKIDELDQLLESSKSESQVRAERLRLVERQLSDTSVELRYVGVHRGNIWYYSCYNDSNLHPAIALFAVHIVATRMRNVLRRRLNCLLIVKFYNRQKALSVPLRRSCR
jgi:chromosome segregation ATPase